MSLLRGQTVIITGAVSGIGRAAALKFADQGSNLGLMDINEEGLRALKENISEAGGAAESFIVDVSNYYQVKEAADRMAEKFGKIDVWVNNAAIGVYGEVGEIKIEEFRRVMDVNFFGQVNGAYVALPYLRLPESSGKIIGILSGLAEIPAPLESPYVSSKFALRGFYNSLYEELKHQKASVGISMILPSSIATPFFEHAKTYLGSRPKPYPPVYSPELVAELIVKRALQPKLETVAGGAGQLFIFLYSFSPKLFHWFQGKIGYPIQKSHKKKSSSGPNNVMGPLNEKGRIKGNQKFYFPLFVSKLVTPGTLTGLGVLFASIFYRRKR